MEQYSGDKLIRLLKRHRKEIVDRVIERMQTSPASTPEYSAFLTSREGRARVRKYVGLCIEAINDPHAFLMDQEATGELRAAQGYPLSGVLEVSTQTKTAIWEILMSRLVGSQSQVLLSPLLELQRLEAALEASKLILARRYVSARERKIRLQSGYLESVYKLASSAFSSRELASTITQLTDIVRTVFEADECGVVLFSDGTEFSTSTERPYGRLSKTVRHRLLRLLKSESPASIRVAVQRSTGRRIENWLVSLISAYGEPVGVLYASRPRLAIATDEMNLLRGFAGALAGAVANSRLFSELAEKERVLRELVRNTIEGQEDERKRLAADIHDGPTQSLMATLYRLEACEMALRAHSREAIRELRAARESIAQTIEDMRRIVYNLRPLILDDLGLLASIRSLAKSLEEQEGPRISVNVYGPERRLPGHYELVLYRIVQESLHNIRHHSMATTVSIELRFEDSGICLTVRDNGCGFHLGASLNELAAKGKFGLIGMRERAERLGGKLTVTSIPNEGTTIHVRIPY